MRCVSSLICCLLKLLAARLEKNDTGSNHKEEANRIRIPVFGHRERSRMVPGSSPFANPCSSGVVTHVVRLNVPDNLLMIAVGQGIATHAALKLLILCCFHDWSRPEFLQHSLSSLQILCLADEIRRRLQPASDKVTRSSKLTGQV
jgi:hypothetical protein